jgi:hypothetical protein
MEYHHVLLLGEIKTGRINFGLSHLSGFASAKDWFELHSGENVGIYAPDGTLIKRRVILDRPKANSWRFNCGVDTFQGKAPGDVLIVRDRDDGNLEISFEVGKNMKAVSDTDMNSDQTVRSVNSNGPSKIFSRPGRGEKLGELINFRGLQHAPVNEQGVVFLFGMVCRELGYLVEVVRSEYPDCQGKRLIRTDPETWERVHIEFEYQSRNFQLHQHDPQACDVIVCWGHNWIDCPMEVVELRTEIKRLRSNE